MANPCIFFKSFFKCLILNKAKFYYPFFFNYPFLKLEAYWWCFPKITSLISPHLPYTLFCCPTPWCSLPFSPTLEFIHYLSVSPDCGLHSHRAYLKAHHKGLFCLLTNTKCLKQFPALNKYLPNELMKNIKNINKIKLEMGH